MGDPRSALESYRACQSIIVPWSEAEPSDDLHRAILAESHEGMAKVHEGEDMLAAAMLDYQRALEIVTALSVKDPIEVRLQLDRARLHSAISVSDPPQLPPTTVVTPSSK